MAQVCWKGYERVPGTKKYSKHSCRKSKTKKRTKKRSPKRRMNSHSISMHCSPGKNKKFATVVNGKCVRYGDPNMTIKKNNPARKRSFCARHRCSQKKDKATPGYQSCKKWNCSTR